MDYIGSKEKLNDWIFSIIKTSVAGGRFLDCCSGSGSTSRYAAKSGFDVEACDILSFPKFMVEGSIGVEEIIPQASKHIEVMNELTGMEGTFYELYSPAGGKLYFTEANAKKIDACRVYLDFLEGKTRSFLMYCLLEALSRVSNTAGTHGAYLKEFKERALAPLFLRAEKTIAGRAKAYVVNFIEILKLRASDFSVIYIDPPYNSRQYAPNYHLYETLVRYDNPEIKGKTGLRDYSNEKSDFCSDKKFFSLLQSVIAYAKCPVYMSYSSDGLATRDQIEECLFDSNLCASLCVHVRPQKRYKADSKRANNSAFLREFLIEIIPNLERDGPIKEFKPHKKSQTRKASVLALEQQENVSCDFGVTSIGEGI